MMCLLCGKEMGKGSLRDVLFQDDLICEECRSTWEKRNIRFRLNGVEVRSDYVYTEGFSKCLIQYKECYDEALRDVFLWQVRKKLRCRYRKYTLCLMPSTEENRRKRGFSHLHGMFENLGLPILEPFEKKDERNQKEASAWEREQMKNDIRLKKGVTLPYRILLCDDTITTGSTILGALSTIDHSRHKMAVYCASANRKWIRQ